MKTFEMPAVPTVVPVATFESVAADVEALQPTIGRYPPRFRDEDDREQIYHRWSDALVAAHA